MNKAGLGWKFWQSEEKRKRKEVEKNLPAFNAEYEQLCKKYKICLEPRIEPTGSMKEVRLYLAVIHISDQKN